MRNSFKFPAAIIPIVCFLSFCSCTAKKYKDDTTPSFKSNSLDERLLNMNTLFTNSVLKENLEERLKYYTDETLCMPEYQLSMRGVKMIESYFLEIFKREEVELFEKEIFEVITMGNTLVELGTFKKEYRLLGKQNLLKQNGKYCNVWQVQTDNSLKLKAECWGYFHPIENPESLVVSSANTLEDIPVDVNNHIAFELMAVNALMEKGVKTHNAALRSSFFTDDGMFLPFADSIKSGFGNINEHLIEYTSNNVSIDSIHVYNQGFEVLGDYVIEYPKFFVSWSLPEAKGISHGKGIRVWQRQADCTLKLYREIGLHNQ
ncbi:hypothetical protein [Chondrinema litorale]|uniref:hypothetical protein n=1 Tax=Chondrinema litorale TaxID=2994555 RepID=UPI0025434F7D|nr:hypothetical protein [Chondrinema litorale]UZR97087.1 hypothetical protein OQ292_23595 [Chondrinema litorale]